MKILHMDASPRGVRSHSRRLSAQVVERLRAAEPDARVLYRDLAKSGIPPITAEWIAAAYTPASNRTPAMQEVLRVSDELIDELLAADAIVIGLPMHNFGPPPAFKAWVDQVVRVHRTFSAGGRKGLAGGRRIFAVLTSGGEYAEGAEHVTPFLKQVFAYIGITDVTVVNVSTGSPAALERTEAALWRQIEPIASAA